MEPFEVMTSESQERMLAIVEPDKVDAVLDIARRWEVRATVIGVVPEPADCGCSTAEGGEVLADAPAKALEEEAPLYDRPRAAPADLVERRADGAGSLPPPDDAGSDLMAMLADTSWVWGQYDHMLFLNTVEGPGWRLGGAAAEAPDHRGRHRAGPRPHHRRQPPVVCGRSAGGRGDDRLRIGDEPRRRRGPPGRHGELPQLRQPRASRGDVAAVRDRRRHDRGARCFGVPCVGGNVSLYNESRGSDIDPTPVIGVLGIVDRLDRRPPGVALVEGGRLVLVGDDRSRAVGLALGRGPGPSRPGRAARCSTWTRLRSGADKVRELVAAGLVLGAHDVGSGGVGVALAEMVVRSGVGVTGARIPDHAHLFSESAGSGGALRRRRAVAGGVRRARRGGRALLPHRRRRGRSVHVKGLVDLGVDELRSSWRNRLPDALGAGTTQG